MYSPLLVNIPHPVFSQNKANLMTRDIVRITFEHYRTRATIVMEGTLPVEYNPPRSDFYFLKTEDGEIEDIRKNTVLSLEQLELL